MWYTTVPLLVNLMKECRSQKTIRIFQNRFEQYDLVIADEMGYISFDREGAELLFTHLSLRAGRKSTIITSNLSFDRWGEIFQNTVMTAVVVDRLTVPSWIVNMNGNSYRLKQTQEWLEQQRAASFCENQPLPCVMRTLRIVIPNTISIQVPYRLKRLFLSRKRHPSVYLFSICV